MGSLQFPCLGLALEVLLNLAPHYFPRSVAHSDRDVLSSALPLATFTSCHSRDASGFCCYLDTFIHALSSTRCCQVAGLILLGAPPHEASLIPHVSKDLCPAQLLGYLCTPLM